LRQLMQEQRDLKHDTEKLQNKPLPDPAEQKAAVEKTADMQRRLGERTQNLLDKMQRLAQERNARDPETAKMLEQAADVGNKESLPGEMKDTAEQQISKQMFNRAIKQQANSIKTMEKMLNQMDEKREAELDRLIKKQRELQKDLENLAERMDKLRKK